MKKVLLVLALSLILAGCDLLPVWFYDAESYRFPVAESFSSSVQVFDWAFRNIHYENSNDWVMPDQTYARRAGNCKGIATLCMYLLHVQLGAEVTMVAVQLVAGDSSTGHALVRVNGDLYDPEDSTGSWTIPWIWADHPSAHLIYELTYQRALGIASTSP